MKVYADVQVVGRKEIKSKNGNTYVKLYLRDIDGDVSEVFADLSDVADLKVSEKNVTCIFDYNSYTGRAYFNSIK